MALGQLWSSDCPIDDSIGQKLFRSYIKKLWPKMAKCGEKKGHLQEPVCDLITVPLGTEGITKNKTRVIKGWPTHIPEWMVKFREVQY